MFAISCMTLTRNGQESQIPRTNWNLNLTNVGWWCIMAARDSPFLCQILLSNSCPTTHSSALLWTILLRQLYHKPGTQYVKFNIYTQNNFISFWIIFSPVLTFRKLLTAELRMVPDTQSSETLVKHMATQKALIKTINGLVEFGPSS